MIARTIRPCTCVNPTHGIDSDPAKVTFPDGTRPSAEMPPFFPMPVGTTLEHPLCWMLCVPGDHNQAPVAVPVDDECRAMVKADNEQREEKILEIRELSLHLDGAGKVGRFVDGLARSYGVYE